MLISLSIASSAATACTYYIIVKYIENDHADFLDNAQVQEQFSSRI